MSITPSPSKTPAIGQWVCVRGSWDYTVGRVTRVTAEYVWRTDDYYKQPMRESKSRILLCGPEADCRLLKEQCTSSQAQEGDDKRKASERHARRVADFIAARQKATQTP